ncbi:SDR family oxidoreductase [Niveibacterium umoris]|uniref:NAD(P)-dependent dehydrogenase (Short-subunit alcohol dehydrogenase family) n=1 Tax=Niveibacterium umoris TaxID=1193620 RepID=A0A840BQY4_9RHOO|nr:SDR family NAD(P)-dependent oxidoreductase [Niveibacterium umoris]MBB4013948.1 NAD(P)-dependent dehydrogenase (short-subunit alcohol dehydrogenase family) [Niveibacterium umoris]
MAQKTVLIAGASRGIGLEFARQYAIQGWKVYAGVRTPAKATELMRVKGVEVIPLDVTSANSIAGAAWHADEDPLDLLVVCAGLYGPETQGFLAPGNEDFDAVMHTNVLGPMRVIQAFADSLISRRGKIAVISSTMGSISGTTSATGLLYRASKAAVNMVAKCAASEYGPRGLTVVSLHPGWVKTAMGGPNAQIEAYDSVLGMRGVLDRVGPADNGAYLNYDGTPIPW